MLLDHVGLALLPALPVLRGVGRISFVLYCFVLTEGFVHTRSRRAYLTRLALSGVVSEIPFDLFLFARPFSPLEQNVFFTLALSLGALWIVDAYARKRPFETATALIALCLASMAARVSYAWLGILLCLCFFAYRENPLRRALALCAIEMLYAVSLLCAGESLSWALTQLCSLAALLPIACYNRKSGSRRFKMIFYASYPLSLLALYAIRSARLIPPYWNIL